MASERINLADPDFEPTDEQLQELSHQAFAGVREQLTRLRAERLEAIACESWARVAELKARMATPASSVDGEEARLCARTEEGLVRKTYADPPDWVAAAVAALAPESPR